MKCFLEGDREFVPQQRAATANFHHLGDSAGAECAHPSHGREHPGGHGVGALVSHRRRQRADPAGDRLGRGAQTNTTALASRSQYFLIYFMEEFSNVLYSRSKSKRPLCARSATS